MKKNWSESKIVDITISSTACTNLDNQKHTLDNFSGEEKPACTPKSNCIPNPCYIHPKRH